MKVTEQRPEKTISAVISDRRSTPRFASTPVADDDLRRIVVAGLESPSGYNLQPWRFVVVQSPEQRRKLRAASHDQPKIEQAPVVIVAFGDPDGWREDLDAMIRIGAEHGYAHPSKSGEMRQMISKYFSEHKNMPMWLNRQVMIALTTMMLMAEALGYDTALMEGFEERKVREAVGAPDRMEAVCLLAIGHREGEDKRYGGRFPANRVIFAESFGRPFEL